MVVPDRWNRARGTSTLSASAGHSGLLFDGVVAFDGFDRRVKEFQE